MPKPPLALTPEVTTASGARYRWDGPRAADLARGISFNTKRGDGFAEGSATLPRRIDRDYVDLNLYDDFALVGADGAVAYEGRVTSAPRSLGDAHSVTVNTAGWMAHAKDQKLREIYVDRDLSRWTAMPTERKAAISGSWNIYDPQVYTGVAKGAVGLEAQSPWSASQPTMCEAWYDAGPGLKAAGMYWSLLTAGPSLSDGNWQLLAYTADAVGVNVNNQVSDRINGSGAFVGNNIYTLFTAPQRFIFWELFYAAVAATGTNTYEIQVQDLAVYGPHGLTRQGSEPAGLYASDVIKDIVKRWCPKLNAGGVQGTTFPIPHLTFLDRTYPYDAFLEVNKYHNWDLAVWENKTLYYQPVDTTTYNWEIRLSDFGTTVDLQGDSADQLANGIVVQYDDVVTGVAQYLTPADFPQLADTSPDNPINQHGLTVWTEIQVSSPTTQLGAIVLGQAALAEFNQAKQIGTIRVTGHVRDAAGHWQQAWKVRAGDTVAITDHPNSSPRIIGETQWDNDSKTLTIAVDSTLQRVEAVMNRLANAMAAANLSN